jgi:hypothetical protein
MKIFVLVREGERRPAWPRVGANFYFTRTEAQRVVRDGDCRHVEEIEVTRPAGLRALWLMGWLMGKTMGEILNK